MVRQRTAELKRLIAPAILAAAISWSAQAQDALIVGDVPYVPTRDEVVERMVRVAGIGKGDYVIDLGSGDGRIVIAAVKAGANRALGVDINPERVHEANENAAKAGVTDRVEFRQENLFDTDISEATVITMYLLPSVNLQLRPRLLDELRPGTRVVSNSFHMQDWEPDDQESVDHYNVYFWIIPAKVSGHWEVSDGNRTFSVAIEQRFQKIEGKATIDGKEVPLQDAQLRGDEIEFTLEGADGKPVRYSGKVSGNTMQGSDAAPWNAKRANRNI